VNVADESFDGLGMTPLWVLAESSNLADGEGDVRASVGREVEQHIDDGTAAPSFFHGRSVGSIPRAA
jgi:hypothetical protein